MCLNRGPIERGHGAYTSDAGACVEDVRSSILEDDRAVLKSSDSSMIDCTSLCIFALK